MTLLAIMVMVPMMGLTTFGDDAYDYDDVQGLMPKELGKTRGSHLARHKKRWGRRRGGIG